nr:uncharacterized protein LOC127308030 [Lolium perenne]
MRAAKAADGVPPLWRSPGGPRPAAPRHQARPAGGARAAAPRRRALDVDPVGGTAARGSSAVYSWSCHHVMSCRPEESVGTPHEVTAEGDFKRQEAHGSLPDSSQNLQQALACFLQFLACSPSIPASRLTRYCGFLAVFGLLSLHPCQ